MLSNLVKLDHSGVFRKSISKSSSTMANGITLLYPSWNTCTLVGTPYVVI